ncbi:hypothetical protein D3C85_1539840 [compost metagenome]
MERLWAANAKAKALFNWEPTYAGHQGFKRGLEETAQWFKDPANLAAYKADRYNI